MFADAGSTPAASTITSITICKYIIITNYYPISLTRVHRKVHPLN